MLCCAVTPLTDSPAVDPDEPITNLQHLRTASFKEQVCSPAFLTVVYFAVSACCVLLSLCPFGGLFVCVCVGGGACGERTWGGRVGVGCVCVVCACGVYACVCVYVCGGRRGED